MTQDEAQRRRWTFCEAVKDYILSLEECKTPEKSVRLAFDWRLR